MTYTFDLTPIGKPRMTRSDKWKKRSCVLEYRAFCDELRRQAAEQHFELPDTFIVMFQLPMPRSWSGAKAGRMICGPHQQKPDLDNMLKSLCDALRKEDSMIYDVTARKRWGSWGQIIIETPDIDHI